MFIVGLTGGIGSGKSTVAQFFNELEIPVYYADVEAKKIMHRSKIIKRKLIAYFGEEVYFNNELNKPFLANLIFNDASHLKFVNSIVHPKVNQHFKRWIKRVSKIPNTNYIIQENAILFENGSNQFFDKIITVTAPEHIKIQRVINRDNSTKNKVLERMNNQWSDALKIEKSDFIISNTDIKNTKQQVFKIHKKLLNLALTKS